MIPTHAPMPHAAMPPRPMAPPAAAAPHPGIAGMLGSLASHMHGARPGMPGGPVGVKQSVNVAGPGMQAPMSGMPPIR